MLYLLLLSAFVNTASFVCVTRPCVFPLSLWRSCTFVCITFNSGVVLCWSFLCFLALCRCFWSPAVHDSGWPFLKNPSPISLSNGCSVFTSLHQLFLLLYIYASAVLSLLFYPTAKGLILLLLLLFFWFCLFCFWIPTELPMQDIRNATVLTVIIYVSLFPL